MTKDDAIDLLRQYRTVVSAMVEAGEVPRSPILEDALGMPSRWPEDGSERKAMRWLGYMQGVLVALGVKRHSQHRVVAANSVTPQR